MIRTSPIYTDCLKLLLENLTLLPDKPEETLESTLDSLWHLAAGTPHPVQHASKHELKSLTEDQITRLKTLLDDRISGIPLAHLIGKHLFMEIEFLVENTALIPRKETELLGYTALGLIKNLSQTKKEIKVIDVCTGMGNLALAFAYHEPKCKVFASDISKEAIALAQKNNLALGLENRVIFTSGDLLEPYKNDEFLQNIDVLTCNPPYISSRKLTTMAAEIINHEPELAFNGGPFGIKIISRLIKDAPQFIKSGGYLCFEVGLGQGNGMIKRLNSSGHFSEVSPMYDNKGDIRVIAAKV